MAHDETFLMCAPRFYRVAYVINPWMKGNVGRGDPAVAARQWEGLRRTLATYARIELVEPGVDLPDMPFTANAGLAQNGTFVPARFRFPQRMPETAGFTEWFRAHGNRVVDLSGDGTFEGEGDALYQPGQRLVWGGYGVRTSLLVYRSLAEILDVEVVPLRLIDERFYHLDTCLCPLPDGRVLYYPDAFDRESLAAIAARVPESHRLEVSAPDAFNFACNAIVVGQTLITNFASDGLRRSLEAWGYDVVVCPLDQFILAGGSAKCLVLRLDHPTAARVDAQSRPPSALRDCTVELRGHLLDRGVMNTVLDRVTDGGGSFEIEAFQPGLRHDQDSWSRLRVVAPSPGRLDAILARLLPLGVDIADEATDVRLDPVMQAGVAPAEFYGTTIFGTEVRVDGRWLPAENQRMDAALVVQETPTGTQVICRLLRDLARGDRVVCGARGVRVQPPQGNGSTEAFGFMSAGVSSERRVELAVERIAWEIRRIRGRGGKVVVVAGPVVIHTGGGSHLAGLVRGGWVQAVLGGNGLATHDIEQALYGTSLGVDLQRGVAVPGGHQHHLRAINLVRAHGSIAAAVRAGQITRGLMHACVTTGVPFALAGSIRDDGPLPDTIMDLTDAQATYARLIDGAEMILMLSSMLHAIGVGNMTPAGVRLVCVDISPAVVTKLADRGSLECIGVITDVGLFLNLLAASLDDSVGEERQPVA